MNCSHCNKKKPAKVLENVEVRVCGNVLNVCVCGDCKTNLGKIMSFATAFPKTSASSAPPRAAGVSKTGRPPRSGKAHRRAPASIFPQQDNAKFDKYALSPEEIKKTQELRPSVRTPDSPAKRQRDDIDKINSGQRCRVFCMAASPSMRGGREKKILAKAMAELRTSNVKMIKDDGFEAVFEAA